MAISAFSASSYSRILGANERINVAVIGLRGRGRNLMDAFAGLYDQGVVVKVSVTQIRNFSKHRIPFSKTTK